MPDVPLSLALAWGDCQSVVRPRRAIQNPNKTSATTRSGVVSKGNHSMNLQPLEDRIVVRPSDSESTTASGLVIPDTAKEKPQQGDVLAVGPGRRSEQTGELVPMDVAEGDTVVYSKYGGTEITVGGEDLLILNARDVLGNLK